MTDRELLELAAKAAGIPIWTDADGTVFTDNPNGIEVEWSPLEDDGDALRLAVKLGFSMDTNTARICYSTEVDVCENAFRDIAATRRAIVRAAAEIGKEMK